MEIMTEWSFNAFMKTCATYINAIKSSRRWDYFFKKASSL